MTCATCKGTKVVRRIERSRPGDWSATYIATGSPPHVARQVEEPCPDCTPRPFAEVRTDANGYTDFHIAGRFFDDNAQDIRRPPSRQSMEEGAAIINAAVEAREARLREPLRELMDALDQTAFANWRMGKTRLAVAFQAAFEALKNEGPEYVPGDVACGLAWDLGAEQAKNTGLWALLNDIAQEGGLAGDRAAEVMRALGMTVGDPPMRLPASLKVDFLKQLLGQQPEMEPWQREIIERFLSGRPVLSVGRRLR